MATSFNIAPSSITINAGQSSVYNIVTDGTTINYTRTNSAIATFQVAEDNSKINITSTGIPGTDSITIYPDTNTELGKTVTLNINSLGDTTLDVDCENPLTINKNDVLVINVTTNADTISAVSSNKTKFTADVEGKQITITGKSVSTGAKLTITATATNYNSAELVIPVTVNEASLEVEDDTSTTTASETLPVTTEVGIETIIQIAKAYTISFATACKLYKLSGGTTTEMNKIMKECKKLCKVYNYKITEEDVLDYKALGNNG